MTTQHKAPEAMTDELIEQGRQQTFSTNNPFCPCDRKTMLKAARWAERTRDAMWAERLQAAQADTVPRDALEAAERERDYWRNRAKTMMEHATGDCWYWQGDGEDNLQSIVNSLPVVIRADQLRELLAQQPAGRAGTSAADIERMIQTRAAAKKAGNLAEAERIRDALAAQGVVLKDGPHGTSWERSPQQAGGEVVAENRELRRMLCLAHAGAGAYMDDGEAQDSTKHPSIDYLRDSLAEINAKRAQRLAATPAPEPKVDGEQWAQTAAALNYYAHNGAWPVEKDTPAPEPKAEPVQLDVVRQAIEERDAMEAQYHALASSMVYEGNSVSWWHSKAKAYRNAVDAVWAALRAAGISPDGTKTCADGVRELADTQAEPVRVPVPEDTALLDYLDTLSARPAGSDLHCFGGRVVLYVRTGIGSQVEASGAGTAREAIRAAMLAAAQAKGAGHG